MICDPLESALPIMERPSSANNLLLLQYIIHFVEKLAVVMDLEWDVHLL